MPIDARTLTHWTTGEQDLLVLLQQYYVAQHVALHTHQPRSTYLHAVLTALRGPDD